MSPFHYHGQPVSAQDAIDLLRNRKVHWRYRLAAKRTFDQRASTLHRQLWSMLQNLFNRKGAA